MKRINNEQILDTIYDLADAAGMRIDEFIDRVEEEFGEQPIETDGLPDEIVAELESARASKKQQRRQARQDKSNQQMNEDIKKFREVFPDVAADDIPDAVWEDVQAGASLVHAYALYLVGRERLDRRAEDINRRNGSAGARAVSDGSTEPAFTKEQVEKMSGKDVKSNYKGILNAMKNWRF